MKRFLKENILIFIYFALACLIELLGVFVTSGKFYILEPWLFLLVQFIFVMVLFCISSNRARHVVSSCFLVTFMIVNLVFIVIFEMTETIFDYGMLNLKNDAMAILESIPINFLFFSISLLAISAYIVFGGRYAKKMPLSNGKKYFKIISASGLALVMILNVLALYFGNRNIKKDIYDKLYSSNNATYSKMGITANFINEMFKGTFSSGVKLGDELELENYIFDKTYTSKFGEEKDYNLVTILVESFEWTAFMQDFELFVNGNNLKDANGESLNSEEAQEVLEKLYPNIYDYYKSSIVLSNFYSREKTDIAENLCLLGAYPTGAYINYDFPLNSIVSSLPATLKTLTDNNISCNAFHNGQFGYYNRNEELVSVGFDNFYASEQMFDWGLTNHQAKGERNLDGEMIDVCADKMFPIDSRFYTHITTITMHGQYGFRQNLADLGYYDQMAEYGILPKTASSKSEEDGVNNYNNFYYYSACVKEFDRALGKIMNELNERELKDNTIVLLYGDHNTYYSSLSNYVKDIEGTDADNYTNLYRVPCMIYYPDMTAVKNVIHTNFADKISKTFVFNSHTNSKNQTTENVEVKKFAFTADITPTLLDMLGINYFENLYFGNSIFSENTSVLYSRAYNVFMTDSIYFSNINKILWQREEGKTKENEVASRYADLASYSKQTHLEETEKKAKILLERLDACNRIFYNDYFARVNVSDNSKTNAEIFNDKLKSIN